MGIFQIMQTHRSKVFRDGSRERHPWVDWLVMHQEQRFLTFTLLVKSIHAGT